MADLYRGKIPIVKRSLNEGFVRGIPDEEPGFGCVERDYDLDPVEMRADPSEMKLIPDSEWDARFDEDDANETSLEHLFLRGGVPAFENLDQGRDGDCWCYSTAHAMMFDRLKQKLLPVRLNPHSVAALTGRPDVGGWCGLSLKFARERGMAVEGTGPGQWPKWSHDLRYDTPECREEMAKYRVEEDYYDFGRREWDQKLSKRQLATCSFNNIACPSDFIRAGHSMCQIRWVRFERGAWGPLVLNSWKGWGYHGLAVLAEWVPDNAVAVRRVSS